MDGIVTAIKLSSNTIENIYTVVNGGVSSTKNNLMLELRDKVTRKGTSFVSEGMATELECKKVLDKRIKDIGVGGSKTEFGKFGVKELDTVTMKMHQLLEKSAYELVRRCISGAPVIIRFHNDCDGSSGAVAIYQALEVLLKRLNLEGFNLGWRMNRSIAYTVDSFYSDFAFFNTFSSIEKPLVLITDFGTGPESEEAMALAHGKCDFVWLDHHPIYKGFPREKAGVYTNPWDHGGDSDYTAGFLTSTMAELIADIDASDLKRASLIGDYSRHADRGHAKAHKLALTLDYLTSNREAAGRLTPKSINSIISDNARLEESFMQAETLLNEAIGLGVNKANRHVAKDGTKIFVIEFRKVVKEGDEYPMPGRYSSWLQNRLEKENKNSGVITIVHHGSFISVRANRETADKLNLIKRVEALKGSSEHVHSVGGHDQAFSIKTDKVHVDHVIALLLNDLGA